MANEMMDEINGPRLMNEPIRNEVSGPVSWLIPAPPKRVRSHLPKPFELRQSSSPKSRPNRHLHPTNSESPNLPIPSPRIPAFSPNRSKAPNFSPPASPSSVKSSTILRAWTKIFETAAHEMYTLCEADIERGLSEFGEAESDSAAIRRTKAAIYSVEYALLEFHALIRRSAVEARFDKTPTSSDQFDDRKADATANEKQENGKQPSSCAWVVSTRPPLEPKEAFDTVADLLDSLRRYSQFTQQELSLSSVNDSKNELKNNLNYSKEKELKGTPVSTIFSQSSPSRRNKSSSSNSFQSEAHANNIRPKLRKKATPSSHIISDHFRNSKAASSLRSTAKEYVPSFLTDISTKDGAVSKEEDKSGGNHIRRERVLDEIEEQTTSLDNETTLTKSSPPQIHHNPPVTRLRMSSDADGDELSSLGGGTEDFGTEGTEEEEDYVERVVLSARRAVWSEAEAWVDAAEKIALSMHDDDDDENDIDDDSGCFGGSDDLNRNAGADLSLPAFFHKPPDGVMSELMMDDSCNSIDEDSVPDSAYYSPLRSSLSSSRLHSPKNSSSSISRSLLNRRSAKSGDGIGNMKVNHLLKLHHQSSSGGATTSAPLLRGVDAKIVASSKDILWRRNVADREQVRAERTLKAETRRKAAYAKAMENQEINKQKLDASTERAAAALSREQKKTAAFAVNNNQKVSEVLFMKSLSAAGFQHGLQQRLKECEDRILATTNRRQAYLQLRTERASARNRLKKSQSPSQDDGPLTPTVAPPTCQSSSTVEEIIIGASIRNDLASWTSFSLQELRSEAQRLGVPTRGTRKQLLSRITMHISRHPGEGREAEFPSVTVVNNHEITHDSNATSSPDKLLEAKNSKKKEMSARRLAHELDASKRWAVLEKRIEVLTTLNTTRDHNATNTDEPNHAAARSTFLEPSSLLNSSSSSELPRTKPEENQYYMSSSDDDDDENRNEEEDEQECDEGAGPNSQDNTVTLAEPEKRKYRKHQRRKKMKEQIKIKTRKAKEEAESIMEAQRWVIDEASKSEMANLLTQFQQLVPQHPSFQPKEQANQPTVSPALKESIVTVNRIVNEFWASTREEVAIEAGGGGKDLGLIRNLVKELVQLKGMSRSHWTSNDHLQRRDSVTSLQEKEDNDSFLAMDKTQLTPQKQLQDNLDVMQVSPLSTLSPSQVKTPTPTPHVLSHNSSTSMSPVVTTLSPDSPFKSPSTTSPPITSSSDGQYVSKLSPEANVIHAFMRAVHLVTSTTLTSNGTYSGCNDIINHVSSWPPAIISTALTGASLWLESHPDASSLFFTQADTDALSILKVAEMANVELIRWATTHNTHKPPPLLPPLLSIIEKASQYQPTTDQFVTAQHVFWRYLCQGKFVLSAHVIVERLMVDHVVVLSEEANVATSLCHVLNCVVNIIQSIGADAFLNHVTPSVVQHQNHIQKIVSLFFKIPQIRSSQSGNLLETIRRGTVSLLQYLTTTSSSSLIRPIELFPNESALQLAKSVLCCLNRLHRLSALELNNEHVMLQSKVSFFSTVQFQNLWCLCRLVITSLGGGEVQSCSLTDLRREIEPLLSEVLELVGFLVSHPPKPKPLKKNHCTSNKESFELTSSETISLLRELLCLPFSLFVRSPDSIYPSLLAIVLTQNPSSNSSRQSLLDGLLNKKHLLSYLSHVKDGMTKPSPTTLSIKNTDVTTLEALTETFDEVLTDAESNMNKDLSCGDKERVTREFICAVLKLCAVANFCYTEWDQVSRDISH